MESNYTIVRLSYPLETVWIALVCIFNYFDKVCYNTERYVYIKESPADLTRLFDAPEV